MGEPKALEIIRHSSVRCDYYCHITNKGYKGTHLVTRNGFKPRNITKDKENVPERRPRAVEERRNHTADNTALSRPRGTIDREDVPVMKRLRKQVGR